MPFFGICLGMQMACIEGARNTAGIAGASTTEFGDTTEPVVGMITEWMSEEGLQERAAGGDLGGTMRLGAYDATLGGNSHVAAIYGTTQITERHRHRYEVNAHYKARSRRAGWCFSGMSPDGRLPEIVERPDHPWFIGVQFHPEIKSRPFDPHPLFAELHRGGGEAEQVGLGTRRLPPMSGTSDLFCMPPEVPAFAGTTIIPISGNDAPASTTRRATPRPDGHARPHLPVRAKALHLLEEPRLRGRGPRAHDARGDRAFKAERRQDHPACIYRRDSAIGGHEELRRFLGLPPPSRRDQQRPVDRRVR